MKVTGTGPGSTDKARDVNGASGAGAVGGTRERRRGGKAESAADGNSEKISISSKAKDAARAKQIASSAPDVDDAKVARFKAAIENGSYKVDAEKVADRLVEEHLGSAF